MKSAHPDHWDFYKRFRHRMLQFSHSNQGLLYTAREILLTGPDLLHLALCLMTDKDVPKNCKLKLGAAVAYFISPIDILPEAILGPIGYLDDIALLAWVLNGILNNIHSDVIDRYWAGSSTALNTVQQVVSISDTLLGKHMFRRIKASFKKRR